MNLNELAKLIKEDPFAKDKWQEMVDILNALHAYTNKKSVALILRGISALPVPKVRETPGGILLASVLVQLSTSFNNAKLFKEAGRIYLQEFHLVEVAREHLEHAKALRCQDHDLSFWILAATTIAEIKGPDDGQHIPLSHLPSNLSNVLRRTERLCLIHDDGTEAQRGSGTRTTQSMGIPTDPTKRLGQAMQSILKRDWNGAQRLLTGLTRGDVEGPALWNAWTQLGDGCYQAGASFQADFAYRSAADLYPEKFESQMNLGLGLYLVRRFSDALDAFLRADDLEANNPVLWCYIGRVHLLIENYGEAENAFRKSVGWNSDVAETWDNLAGALGCQNKLEEALTASRRALQLNPSMPEAHFKIGLILYSQRKFEAALGSLSSAASHPVLSFYANAYISMCFSETRVLTGAERAIHMAAQAVGSVPELLGKSWWALGRSRLDLMELKMAIAALNEACRLNPTESQNWLDLGFAYQFAQDAKQALNCFNRAVELDRVAC